jgi:hypothetical protein
MYISKVFFLNLAVINNLSSALTHSRMFVLCFVKGQSSAISADKLLTFCKAQFGMTHNHVHHVTDALEDGKPMFGLCIAQT